MNIWLKEFGEHIRTKRKELKMTQENLAYKSNLSVNYIRKLEKGLANPSLTTIRKISRGLNISIITISKEL